MAKVEGIERVQRALTQAASKYFESPQAIRGESVIVGYTANYALYVHENKEAKHTAGQAKYLEQPARKLGHELAVIVRRAMAGGAKLLQALFLAGLRLQRESQKLVPVDTGNLKGSAFTRKE